MQHRTSLKMRVQVYNKFLIQNIFFTFITFTISRIITRFNFQYKNNRKSGNFQYFIQEINNEKISLNCFFGPGIIIPDSRDRKLS